ncbi:MAG: hypothetical protein ACXWDO_06305 [Bacteroidia bacterium]
MRVLFCLIIIVSAIGGNAFGQKPPFEAQLLNSSQYKRVITLNDGGFLLHETPYDYYYYGYNYDSFAYCHTTRYDECFNKLWSKTFKTTEKAIYYGNWFSPAVAQTKDGGFVIANYEEDVANLWPVVHKLDENGKLTWSTKLYFDVPVASAKGNGYVESFVATVDSGIVVFGNASFSTPTNDEYYYIITKLNKNGVIVWSKKYLVISPIVACPTGGASWFGLEDKILHLSDGGFLFRINWFTENASSSVIKIDSIGNIVWAKGIKIDCNNKFNFGYDAVEDKDGNLYITGQKNQNDSSYTSPIITKLNKAGTILWTKVFNIPGWTTGIELVNNNRLKTNIHNYNDYRSYILPRGVVVNTLNLDGEIIQSKIIDSSYKQYYWTGYWWLNSNTFSVDIHDDLLTTGNNYNKLQKLKGNNLQSCRSKDTTISNEFISFNLINTWLPLSNGYKMAFGELDVQNNKRRIKLLCGKEFYPISDIGNDTILCDGQFHTLRAGEDNLGFNHKFMWGTGSTDSVITVNKSGKYWLARHHPEKCVNLKSCSEIFGLI